MSNKVNLLGLDREAMTAFFVGMGEKPFRATQMMKWIHQQWVEDFDEMSNLSKAIRAQLKELAEIRTPEIIEDQQSKDGTRKWLLRLDTGSAIETVFIPEDDRGTLCVSSQVGCALECTFCSTARQGFSRNLQTWEIIAQIWAANKALGADPKTRKVTNVVFMGMGEPLLNLKHVAPAAKIMMDDFGYGLSKRRVTISTAGVVPGIDMMVRELDMALAISLHAPNDALRDEIVPINQKYPLKELLEACKRYLHADGRLRRRILFEYVMLEGVNDRPEHAQQLVKLFKDFAGHAKFNLIPFNPFPGSGYRTSKAETIEAFREILVKNRFVCTVRKTRGDDIDAACGQLAGKVNDRTTRQEKWRTEIKPEQIKALQGTRA